MSFTEPPGNILEYQPWLLETNGGWRTLQPVEVKPHKQAYVARFADVADRDEAGGLSGKHIAVARHLLPELAQDEFYWRDLEGLAVWNRGERIGVVDHLIETGANPVLVVLHDDDPAAQTLIPFVAQYVGTVDLAAGRIEVDWVSWDEETG
jgi:16S rRNA processing protein RimM